MSAHHPWTCMDMHVECMSAHHPWTCMWSACQLIIHGHACGVHVSSSSMDMHVECMSAHHPWTCMWSACQLIIHGHAWTCMDMHGPNQTTCLHALPANRVCLVLWHANACLSLSTWLGLDWLHNKQLSSLASRQCCETFVCLYVILQITTQYQ